MNSCIFCGSTDLPSSVEDVIPRWARKAFNIQGAVTASVSNRPGDARRQVGRPMDVLRVVLKDALCRSCNSGWLGGRIEKPASRLFVPMAIDKAPTVLDIAAQRLSAFWAAKTVFLLELALRQMHAGERAVEGYVASEVELGWMRTHNEPHWRTMVWLGSYDCEKSKPVVYEPSSAVLPTADGVPVVGHLATFTLGYVAFQVFSVDFVEAELHKADVWNTHVPDSLSRHLTRIWPKQLVTPDVSWPPEQFTAHEWRRLVTWDGALRPGGLNGLSVRAAMRTKP